MAIGQVSRRHTWLRRVPGYVMPWVFLPLRIALIPTGCLVVLAILFYVIPQSREVLAGLPELPADNALSGAGAMLVQLCRLFCYVGASIGLALAVWYAARLLCTVEVKDAMPVFWRDRDVGDEDARAGESLAITWLPRVYGVAALTASVGALTYASYGPPTLDQTLAIALIAFSIFATLTVAVGVILVKPPRTRINASAGLTADDTTKTAHGDRTRRLAVGRLILLLGGIAVCISFFFHASVDQTRWVKFVGFSSIWLPAIGLWFLVVRRRLFDRFFKEKRSANEPLKIERVRAMVAVVICAALIALLILAFLPAGPIRAIGSAAAVTLFLSAAVLLLAGIQLLLRSLSRIAPGMSTVVVLLALTLLVLVGREPIGRERLDDVNAVHTPTAVFTVMSGGPQYIVNAYGGGIRSAIYTAQVLAFADDASCGEFGKHIMALSGVSGGSLGVATYLLARQELAPRGLWQHCDPEKEAPLTKVVSSALVQDHLSPAIARAVSIDLLPPIHPRRGQALLDSWNDALQEALKRDGLMGNEEPDITLALPLGKLDGAISPKPKVFFNATNADSGKIVSFSNENPKMSSTLVGLAVLHSARFPIVSPPGAYQVDGEGREERLVDGGYADNSGALTLSHAMSERLASLNLIDIDGNPAEACTKASNEDSPCEVSPADSAIPTAVLALLRARSAHADLAENDLAQSVQGRDSSQADSPRVIYATFEPKVAENGTSDHPEPAKEIHVASLGWYVGTRSAYWLAKSARENGLKLCKAVTGKQCTLPPLAEL